VARFPIAPALIDRGASIKAVIKTFEANKQGIIPNHRRADFRKYKSESFDLIE